MKYSSFGAEQQELELLRISTSTNTLKRHLLKMLQLKGSA